MGWRKVQIKEFLTPREERYKPDDPAIAGMLRIEKIDFTGKIIISDKPSKTDMIVVHPGDFVISGINVSKGAMAVYQGDVPVKATIHYSSYKVDHSVINLEYFKRFLKSPVFIRILKEQVPGGIKTEIKPKHLMPLVIDLPELPEQEAILSRFLNTEEEYVELTGEIANQKALLKKYRQAILQEAIQGKLTEDWRKENSDVEPAAELLKRIAAEKAELVKQKKIRKQKPLSPIKPDEIPFEIPESWQWCQLEDLCRKISTGPFGSMLHKSDYVKNGIPLVNPINLIENQIVPNDKMQVSTETKKRLLRYELATGDLIIARRGDLSKSAIVSMNESGWLCGTGSFFITLQKEVFPEFILLLYTSKYCQDIVNYNAVGATMSNLNQKLICTLPLALPPLAEQQEIVRRVEAKFALCDVLEVEISASAHTAETLSSAILQEVFDNHE